MEVARAENMDISKTIALAKRVARSLMNENSIGVVLFGSLAKNRADELSDLDLALIVKGGELGLEKKNIEGVEVEVWRYDVKHFLHTFEDEKYRGQEDSWFISSLWVGLLREGVILEDPQGLLKKWRRKALDWKWKEREILPLVRKAKSCLRVAIEAYSQGKPFEGVVALRDCCYNLTNAQIMIHNGIPSVRPKDIYGEVKRIGLKEFFDRVQGLEGLKRNQVEGLLDEYRKLLDEIWKEPRGARTEYQNAVKSLTRGELEAALLNARYSAFYVGCRILRLEKRKILVRPYDAKSHLKMLREIGRKDFIEIYRKLHRVEKISLKYLGESIELVQRVLDSLPLNSN